MAVVLMPLIRFEGLALSGGVIIALALLGKWRQAGVLALAAAVLLAGYAGMMAHLGLSLLPGSVLKARYRTRR